jgi:hypothetical protein
MIGIGARQYALGIPRALVFSGTAGGEVVVANGTAAGQDLQLRAGNAGAGVDLAGGSLVLSSGNATGSGASQIRFMTAGGDNSGGSVRPAVNRMIIDGLGRVGIGTVNPVAYFQIGDAPGTMKRTVFIQAGTETDNNNSPVAIVNNNNYGMTLGAPQTRNYAEIRPVRFVYDGTTDPNSHNVRLLLAPGQGVDQWVGVGYRESVTGNPFPAGKLHVYGGQNFSNPPQDALPITIKAQEGGLNRGGKIILEQGQGEIAGRMGYVLIKDELRLNPVQRGTQNPTEGALVYDSNNELPYYYKTGTDANHSPAVGYSMWLPVKKIQCYQALDNTPSGVPGQVLTVNCYPGYSAVGGGVTCRTAEGNVDNNSYVFLNRPVPSGWRGACMKANNSGEGRAWVSAICCANAAHVPPWDQQ